MNPSIFISYSHDTFEHEKWVIKLASDLREHGINVTLDKWDLKYGQDLVGFMQDGINKSDRVMLICSDNYVKKAEAGIGGVGFERLIVTNELVDKIDTLKFIPVIKNNDSKNLMPSFLGPRLYVDFRNDEHYSSKLNELVRELYGQPIVDKPELGRNPFSGALPESTKIDRVISANGILSSGKSILESDRLEEFAKTAHSGKEKLELVGGMEIRFALHSEIKKSQLELINAVRSAEIKTFGWPIAILLENREEYRPRPVKDGILAEVSIGQEPISGRKSYDYWALRTNGDFYLLQSFFEDLRAENKLFFDTRIIRITETLMFCVRLYKELGVSDDASISMRFSHEGLSGRELVSANRNRHIFPAKTKEDLCQGEFTYTISELQNDIVECVRKIAEPIFMLFDYREFSKSVYHDIVTKFKSGEVP